MGIEEKVRKETRQKEVIAEGGSGGSGRANPRPRSWPSLPVAAPGRPCHGRIGSRPNPSCPRTPCSRLSQTVIAQGCHYPRSLPPTAEPARSHSWPSLLTAVPVHRRTCLAHGHAHVVESVRGSPWRSLPMSESVCIRTCPIHGRPRQRLLPSTSALAMENRLMLDGNMCDAASETIYMHKKKHFLHSEGVKVSFRT